MNKAILMGRLTRDPEVRYSQGEKQTAIARYSLAVNRSFKKEGEPDADFINIVSFGKAGEFAEKYFKKGQLVCVVGRIQTSTYEKDGVKQYRTDVIAEEQHFAESKKSEDNEQRQGRQQPSSATGDGFMNIEDSDMDELPFN
jgi:single-strand DNA-binding protein